MSSPITTNMPPNYTAITLPRKIYDRLTKSVLPPKKGFEFERWTYLPQLNVMGVGRGDVQLAAARYSRPGLPPWDIRASFPMGLWLRLIPPIIRERKSEPLRTLWVTDASKPDRPNPFRLTETPRLLTWLETLISDPKNPHVHLSNQLPFTFAKGPPSIRQN